MTPEAVGFKLDIDALDFISRWCALLVRPHRSV